jgi:hypothetical protein
MESWIEVVSSKPIVTEALITALAAGAAKSALTVPRTEIIVVLRGAPFSPASRTYTGLFTSSAEK